MTAFDLQRNIEIVDEQQQKLRFGSFDYSDALQLGMQIIEEAKNSFHNPVSVRIDIDGVTAFYHLMDGTNLGNDWWMRKKLNGSQITGDSSFMNYLKIIEGDKKESFPWVKDEGSFAAVGGCFPITLINGKPKGFAMVSGLPHYQDHQLLVNSLSNFTGIKVPDILWDNSDK